MCLVSRHAKSGSFVPGMWSEPRELLMVVAPSCRYVYIRHAENGGECAAG